MKEFLPTPPGFPKDIPRKGAMRNDPEASTGSRISNPHGNGTGDSAQLNVEKDLYALLDLCVRLLELETKEQKISGMQHKLRDVDGQTTATLKKEEMLLRQIISATRKRLRCAGT